jgi:hypothetical protein
MPGNPNPSPATRFSPGNPGGGKTSEQKRLEYEAAEMAARARHKLLSVITEKLKLMPDGAGADISDILSSETLRLFKDSEDRAHGTPKQAVDVSALLTFNPTIAGDDRDL